MKPYKLSHISRQRGGTFFTMLIFIMMLISCALMYYYFQRSRLLEREIAGLKNGQPVESDSGWLGWMNPSPAAPKQNTTPVASSLVNNQAAPPPVAMATPLATATPMPVASATTVSTELPANTPAPSTTLQPAVHTSDEVQPPAGETGEEPSEQAKPTQTPAKFTSVYDAPPSVRVKAPRRNP